MCCQKNPTIPDHFAHALSENPPNPRSLCSRAVRNIPQSQTTLFICCRMAPCSLTTLLIGWERKPPQSQNTLLTGCKEISHSHGTLLTHQPTTCLIALKFMTDYLKSQQSCSLWPVTMNVQGVHQCVSGFACLSSPHFYTIHRGVIYLSVCLFKSVSVNRSITKNAFFSLRFPFLVT